MGSDSNTAAKTHIAWRDWTPKAFSDARDQDRLVLLDSGATWCHWCHVMDRVTYEDPEVIRLVHQRFVPVRIDRDRRPALDERLQRAPAVASPTGGAGGWPLTVVLDGEGHVLLKATFLPPRAGGPFGSRLGLCELLREIDRAWRSDRRELIDAAARLRDQAAGQYRRLYRQAGTLGEKAIEQALAGVKNAYDERHGGFGGAPKFFAASALELLVLAAWRGDDEARRQLVTTLEHMAAGGVYDHVGGGFHRYSVDERWHVPHFEKMAYDNAALLAVYADAHALTGSETFARVARETVEWIVRVLGEPSQPGALAASQDADVGLDDDGDYFTWTEDEFRDAIGENDLADLGARYYGVDASGDMHARPGRNVLHAPKSVAQVGSSRVDLQACKLEYSIVSPK